MISAVVLAAGDAFRMGRPKALLDWRGKPFIEHVCDALRRAGVEDRVVVLGSASRDILAAWKPAGEKVTVNPRPGHGQLSSLRCGLMEAAGGAGAYMVCLVDQPTVLADTYRRIIEFWNGNRDSIVIPRVLRPADGRLKRGHPIIIPAAYRHLCFEGPLEKGLHWVTHNEAARVADLEVRDPEIIRDIDTPEDYAALVKAG